MSQTKEVFKALQRVGTREVTAEEFFGSRAFRLYCETILATYTASCFRQKAGANFVLNDILDVKEKVIGYTNGSTVHLVSDNALSKVYDKLEKKFACNLGILYHEICHILYADFGKMNAACEAAEQGQILYPIKPSNPMEAAIIKDVDAALKTDAGKTVVSAFMHEVCNIVIDPHDENMFLRSYPNSIGSEAIATVRFAQMSTKFELEEYLDETVDPLQVMYDLLLQYARFHTVCIFTERGWASVYGKTLKAIMPFIDTARDTNSTKERFETIFHIMLYVWPFLREQITNQEMLNQLVEALCDALQQGKNQQSDKTSQSNASGSGSSVSSNNDSSGAQTPGDSGQATESNSSAQAGNSGKESDGKNAAAENGNTETGNQRSPGSAQTAGSPVSRSNAGDKQKNSSGGNSGAQNKSPAANSHQGADIVPDFDYSKASADAVKKVLNTLSKKLDNLNAPPDFKDKAGKSARKERGRTAVPQADAAAKEGSLVSAFSSILSAAAARQFEDAADQREISDMEAFRKGLEELPWEKCNMPVIATTQQQNASEGEIEAYNARKQQIGMYATNMQRKLMPLLRRLAEPDLERHKQFGPKIDGRDFYRKDCRVFKKKGNPVPLDIAICLLCDGSASMKGEKLQASIDSAIVLDSFATGIRIPIMIAEHRTTFLCNNRGVQFNVIAGYKRYSGLEKYRIMGMCAAGSNHDGAALRIALETLSKRPERHKIFIINSDGAPNFDGYRGEVAYEDMKSVVDQYRRKGIHIFCAGIGKDREVLEGIYGKSFLDVGDLNELPNMMVRLVKQFIR